MDFNNQYLTYIEYKKLEGNLSEMPFNLLEYQAEQEVDELTSNRFKKLEEYPKELKLCINELINSLQRYNEASNKSSETVGSYSVSYDKPVTKEKKQALKSIITKYLSRTKVDGILVLYCGADVNDK